MANGTNGWTRLDGLTFRNGRYGLGDQGVVDGRRVWLEVSRCRFVNNGAQAAFGESPPLHLDGGRVVIRASEFTGNRGGFSGAARLQNVREQLEIRDCLFRGNEAVDCGSLSVVSGTGVVEGCEFLDNRSLTTLFVSSGGAAQFWGSAMQLRRCRFVSNRAPNGSAIGLLGGAPIGTRTILANNLFIHNFASSPNPFNPSPVAVMVENVPAAVVHNTFFCNDGGTRSATRWR